MFIHVRVYINFLLIENALGMREQESLSVKTKLLGFIGGFFSLVILIITMFSFFNFKSSSVENNERNMEI